MLDYQKDFITFALEYKALCFGDFTLKSGRKSPYFFNAGAFNGGEALKKLGMFYAEALMRSHIEYDLLFGLAYKGIPLATTTAIALLEHGRNVPVAFNRKEPKLHGEGGELMGAPLTGRVLIIDDVITAGTAFHEARRLIEKTKAQIIGELILLDRQERGQDERSAIQALTEDYHLQIISIIECQHLIAYLETLGENTHLERMYRYQEEYGILRCPYRLKTQN